jgi:hypothetical protein
MVNLSLPEKKRVLSSFWIQTETVSKEEVKKEVKEAYDATKAYTQEQMQAFREQTEARLAEYKKEID